MRKLTLIAAAALAAAATLGAVAPAQAATASCNGVKATLVVPAGATARFEAGTDRADVIAVTGGLYSTPLTIYARNGNDTICNLSATRVIVYGGAGDDTYFGNSLSNTFYGGLGNDWANGANGAETLYGGPGNDWLVGGLGNDFVSGGPGNDTVFGGDGVDTVVGGTGTDTVSGHGLESADDTVADTVYAGVPEILSKGKYDVYRTTSADVTALNKRMRTAFENRWKDSCNLSYNQVITGETLVKAIIASNKKTSVNVAFFIES